MNRSARRYELALLRESYRSLIRQGGEHSCPRAELLAELVAGQLSAAARDRVADHLSRCRRCRRDYRVLVALDAAATPRPRRWGWTVTLAAAALALMLAGGIELRRREPARALPSVDGLRASVVDVEPTHGAVLAAAPGAFSWPPQTGATGYRLRLFDARAEVLWESPILHEAQIKCPDERLEPRAGEAYSWIVEVEGPVRRCRLGPFGFALRAPG